MLTEHIMATRPYAQAALLTVTSKGKEMSCPTAHPQLTCNKVPRGIWEHIAKTWMAQAFHRKVRAEDSHFHQPQGAGHRHQPGICSAAGGWGGSLCTPHGMAVNKQNECSDQLFNSQKTKWLHKSALQQSANKVSTQFSSSNTIPFFYVNSMLRNIYAGSSKQILLGTAVNTTTEVKILENTRLFLIWKTHFLAVHLKKNTSLSKHTITDASQVKNIFSLKFSIKLTGLLVS